VIAALQQENEAKEQTIKSLRDEMEEIQRRAITKEEELREWSEKRMEGRSR
jgi:hypothetical protein